MGKRHSIAEARSSLPRLIREAESGKPVELTRRGQPVAVLVENGRIRGIAISGGWWSGIGRRYPMRPISTWWASWRRRRGLPSRRRLVFRGP